MNDWLAAFLINLPLLVLAALAFCMIKKADKGMKEILADVARRTESEAHTAPLKA